MMQMRPSFAHVDKSDDREAQLAELGENEYYDEVDEHGVSINGGGTGGGVKPKGKGKAKAATTADAPPAPVSSSSGGPSGFARRESEHAKAARLRSWAHQQSAELSEAFVQLEVHVRRWR
jgi:hypothetical protein